MHTRSNFIGKAGFYASSIRSAELARPLDVLNGADDITNVLNAYISVLNAQIEYGRGVIKSLASTKLPINEGMVIPHLEHSQALMQQSMKTIEGYKSSILVWNLRKEEAEELLSVVKKAMDTVEALYDQQEDLRWAILEHNVDCMPKGKPLIVSTPKELREALSGL